MYVNCSGKRLWIGMVLQNKLAPFNMLDLHTKTIFELSITVEPFFLFRVFSATFLQLVMVFLLTFFVDIVLVQFLFVS